ncbi:MULTISPECIES: 5-oxoprolinase subunit B family protein [Prauserella salsuginis group]|uniref:Urea carboxylase n=2 Tax=Prauserella salsuginis group TaxID=2893672 RepID=A0A839XX87_9PSEU|nr:MULTISPECIES: allophanate hydrolase subunit 1 [Prauserella salsuginis group]MBB3664636.1 urea carboxylase [Prauserella sediminis]MCR3722084.1 urea carboxylase [Prauserella flava]MCR3736081.1 urea carboxylase [Prauserella salsuginis]
MTEKIQLPPARYEYGGDEFVFVELDQAMSLEANFAGMAVTNALREEAIEGVVDICPSNASYMVQVDPDRLDPRELVEELRRLESTVGTLPDDYVLKTRVVDVPVLFNDPWTHETLMRFRDRHQDPEATDLEYAARINGFDSVQGVIDAMTSAPWIVTMLGFVPGLPFCYQLVPRDRQIQVPKYVRPRTDTPERTFGFGGAFAVVYPVRGAGGYQMFGMAPAPVFDLSQSLPDFADDISFPNANDVLRYRAIDMAEFESTRSEVESGTFRYRIREVEFEPASLLADPDAVNRELLEVLYR